MHTCKRAIIKVPIHAKVILSRELQPAAIYSVAHLHANLGWVDLNFHYSTVCLILPGLMGVWQKRLGSWARWWNSQIQVNRTQVLDQIGHPLQWQSKMRQVCEYYITTSGTVQIRCKDISLSVFAHCTTKDVYFMHRKYREQ